MAESFQTSLSEPSVPSALTGGGGTTRVAAPSSTAGDIASGITQLANLATRAIPMIKQAADEGQVDNFVSRYQKANEALAQEQLTPSQHVTQTRQLDAELQMSNVGVKQATLVRLGRQQTGLDLENQERIQEQQKAISLGRTQLEQHGVENPGLEISFRVGRKIALDQAALAADLLKAETQQRIGKAQLANTTAFKASRVTDLTAIFTQHTRATVDSLMMANMTSLESFNPDTVEGQKTRDNVIGQMIRLKNTLTTTYSANLSAEGAKDKKMVVDNAMKKKILANSLAMIDEHIKGLQSTNKHSQESSANLLKMEDTALKRRFLDIAQDATRTEAERAVAFAAASSPEGMAALTKVILKGQVGESIAFNVFREATTERPGGRPAGQVSKRTILDAVMDSARSEITLPDFGNDNRGRVEFAELNHDKATQYLKYGGPSTTENATSYSTVLLKQAKVIPDLTRIDNINKYTSQYLLPEHDAAISKLPQDQKQAYQAEVGSMARKASNKVLEIAGGLPGLFVFDSNTGMISVDDTVRSSVDLTDGSEPVGFALKLVTQGVNFSVIKDAVKNADSIARTLNRTFTIFANNTKDNLIAKKLDPAELKYLLAASLGGRSNALSVTRDLDLKGKLSEGFLGKVQKAEDIKKQDVISKVIGDIQRTRKELLGVSDAAATEYRRVSKKSTQDVGNLMPGNLYKGEENVGSKITPVKRAAVIITHESDREMAVQEIMGRLAVKIKGEPIPEGSLEEIDKTLDDVATIVDKEITDKGNKATAKGFIKKVREQFGKDFKSDILTSIFDWAVDLPGSKKDPAPTRRKISYQGEGK